VEAAAVKGPFDILGRVGEACDPMDDVGQGSNLRFGKDRGAGDDGAGLLKRSAGIEPVAVGANAALDEVFAESGSSLDNDARAAGDGVDREGDARDLARTMRWTTTAMEGFVRGPLFAR
jgi:hypothetical protein